MAFDSTSEVSKRKTEKPENINGYSWTVREPQHEENCPTQEQSGTSLQETSGHLTRRIKQKHLSTKATRAQSMSVTTP